MAGQELGATLAAESGAPAAKTRGAGAEYTDPLFGRVGYAVMLTVGMLVWSYLSVYLWSSMFIGVGSSSHPYAILRDNYWLSSVLLGVGLLLGITLYVLDVFMPSHLPGQYGALWNNDRYVGRSLLVLVVILVLAGCLFMAAYYPHFPMLIFIVVGMVIPVGIRGLTMPKRVVRAKSGARQLKRGESKLNELKTLVRKSDDALNFFQAFALACFVSSLAIFFPWIIMAVSGQICFSDCDNQFTVISDSCEDESDSLDSGLVVFLAMSPLFVAFANLIFGLFGMVRVVMNSTYLSTSRHRNELATALHAKPDALERNQVVLEQAAEPRPNGGSEVTREVSEEFESMELKGKQKLTKLVKAVVFCFIVLIGFGYAGALMVWADNEIASMFVSLLVIFFIGFIAMTIASFSRIAHALGDWLIDLPLWGKIIGFMKNDWVQAIIVCASLPLLLPFLVLCIVNQRVRSLRGISGFVDQDAVVASGGQRTIDPADPPADIHGVRDLLKELHHLLHPSDKQPESPLRFWLTARAHGVWQKVRRLQWLSIYTKVYILCLLPFAFYVGSLIFNAGFAWLISILKSVHFGLVIALTFVIGVSAFLWPTVPGMVVYMFGGLLIPSTCTIPANGSDDDRFWVGVCINIVLGFFLKLSACAIQQKVIGGQLGKKQSVQQTCRVHTKEMRAVEAVLKQPGLSPGKVAILCGGPDWPTSVLCGILGLSLVSCEIGTTPIFFYIIPCSLTGSAYLRANESTEWEATASAMVLATTVITGLLWVVMAWALQKEYEQHGEELGKPLRRHADLWFADHKADTIQARCACAWNELPRTLRNCFAFGAFVQILLSHCLVFGSDYLFGYFTVSESFDDIEWYVSSIDPCGGYTSSGTVQREYCVFAAAGLALIAVYLVAWVPYKVLYRYWKNRNLKIKEEIEQEFDEEYQMRWSDAFFQVGHLGKDVEVAMATTDLTARARQQLRAAAKAGTLLPAVRVALAARPVAETPGEVPEAEAEGGENDREKRARLSWADPEHGARRSREQLEKQNSRDSRGMFPMLHWCTICNSSGFIETGEASTLESRNAATAEHELNVPTV